MKHTGRTTWKSCTEWHPYSSGTGDVQRGRTNRSFKSPFLRAATRAEQSSTKRYLGSHHWLEWGHVVHLKGALPSWQMWQAHITLMPGEDQSEVLSLWEWWWGLRKNISCLHSFINSRPVRKGSSNILGRLVEIDGLMSVCPVFTSFGPLNFSCVKLNICHCDASWHILVLWLLEGARIWKEASLISCSQNPAVSCPLCKLPVNEWAGHLTPWGSTSGSSDHQLLCLGLSHAPVGMMNSEHKCEALTSPYVSSSSLLAFNTKQVWWAETKYSGVIVLPNRLKVRFSFIAQLFATD